MQASRVSTASITSHELERPPLADVVSSCHSTHAHPADAGTPESNDAASTEVTITESKASRTAASVADGSAPAGEQRLWSGPKPSPIGGRASMCLTLLRRLANLPPPS